MNRKVGFALAAAVAPLLLPWVPFMHVTDKINAIVAIATVEAVIAALFNQKIQSFLHSPSMVFEFSNDLVEEQGSTNRNEPHIWIRGKLLNHGDRTAVQCRIRITEIQNMPNTIMKSEIYNGYLQWQGGLKDSINLNPGEDRIFDLAVRYCGRPDFEALSFLPGGDLSQTLGVAQHSLVLKVFGDNFTPQTEKIRLNITGHRREDVLIERW